MEIMQPDELRTTIALHKKTVQRLGAFGRFNESYEDVVNRLIDQTTHLSKREGKQ
jgi:hypothetical protein